MKKTYSFRAEPGVMKSLKLLSALYGKPLGDIIEGLIDFSESAHIIKDEDFQRRFKALFDQVMVNAGIAGVMINPSDMRDDETKSEYLARKSKEARERLDRERRLEELEGYGD